LAGNEEGAAALEITLKGPSLKILHNCTVAITGGDLSPIVNGRPISMWAAVHIQAGSLLEFGRSKSGCRSYLAINGGFNVPQLMGSRSTYLRAGIGGFQGRALRAGDLLLGGPGNLSHQPFIKPIRRLSPSLIPEYRKNIHLRVIPGPQWDYFTKESQERFLSSSFLVSPQSDRMGYRLEGERLDVKPNHEHITDPIPLGAIQVPAGGNPIILLADHQTTGGYPKIATIISVDIPKIAQGRPGDEVRFHAVDVDESHHLLREQERVFRILKAGLRLAGK
jgi:antagonist of KipI